MVFALAIFTAPEFLAVSSDAGGATTGPVTVPFILSLGVGSRQSVPDRFPGQLWLCRASGFRLPILAVLLLGGDLQVMAKLFAGFTQTIVDVTLAFYP